MKSARTLLPAAAAALLLGALPADAGSAPAPVVQKTGRPSPAWYTPDLHRQVVAAGARGVPVPDGVEIPASALGFTGIRPGSWMLSPAWCTMNFVFGTPGTYSIGTAGHCTEKVGDEVVLLVAGPTSQLLLVHIGNTAKTTGDGGIGNDFALVSIRPELQSWVSPAMAHVGGPTGRYTGTGVQPLVHSGHGLGIGTGGTPRAALSLWYTNNAVYWAGGTMLGDSGSAIRLATGQALANITHIVVDLKYPGADSVGTRIGTMERIAGKPVATCALPAPWPLPGCP